MHTLVALSPADEQAARAVLLRDPAARMPSGTLSDPLGLNA
jgi:hypothetical protein